MSFSTCRAEAKEPIRRIIPGKTERGPLPPHTAHFFHTSSISRERGVILKFLLELWEIPEVRCAVREMWVQDTLGHWQGMCKCMWM